MKNSKKYYLIIFLLIFLITFESQAQPILYSSKNICQFMDELPDSLKKYCDSCKACPKNLLEGVYVYKSSSNFWRKMAGNKIIRPEVIFKKIDHENKFLIPDKNGIVLFKKMNPENSKDVAGILYSPSFIEIQLIQRIARYSYKDYLFSNEEWLTLKINDSTYYTDIASVASCNYWDNGIDEADKGYYNKPMQQYNQYFYFLDLNNSEDCISSHAVIILEATGNNFKIKYVSPKILFHWNCECGTSTQRFYYDKIKKTYVLLIEDPYSDQLYCYWDGKNFSYDHDDVRNPSKKNYYYLKHYDSRTNRVIRKKYTITK